MDIAQAGRQLAGHSRGVIFKFGEAAWTYWGINRKAASLYILFPLLTKEQQEIFRLQIIAFAEAKKKGEKQRTEVLRERRKLLNYRATGL